MDYAKHFMSHRNQPLPTEGKVKKQSGYMRDAEIPLSESSSYRKRKYASPLEVSSQKTAASAALQQETGKEVQGQGEKDTKQMWRQHISKNPLKTVSVCSESIGSLSEGSGNEGEMCPGSAVHSLLHMSESSSPNRGSTSGSDESDTASSKQTSQIVQSIIHNQSRLQTHRVSETLPAPHPSPLPLTHKPFTYPYERSKSLQAILSSCGPPLQVARTQPHWRLPERPTAHYSHSLAGPTATAVASIYPTIAIEYGNSGPFKGYLPMNCAVGNQSSVLDARMRNHDFTVYDGHKSRSPKSL